MDFKGIAREILDYIYLALNRVLWRRTLKNTVIKIQVGNFLSSSENI